MFEVWRTCISGAQNSVTSIENSGGSKRETKAKMPTRGNRVFKQ